CRLIIRWRLLVHDFVASLHEDFTGPFWKRSGFFPGVASLSRQLSLLIRNDFGSGDIISLRRFFGSLYVPGNDLLRLFVLAFINQAHGAFALHGSYVTKRI